MSSVEILHADVTVDAKSYEEGLKDVLAIIRPEWKRDNINFKLLTQGMLNLMVLCYVGEDKPESHNVGVVARVFGMGFGDIKPPKEQEIECTKCFAELGLGPKVFGTFTNGICSEYIVGTPYTWADISAFKDVKMGRRVAKYLARVHCDETLRAAKKCKITKGMDPAAAIGFILDAWPIPINDPELHEKFYDGMYTKEELKKEMAIFMEDLKEGFMGMPQLFSHGDPNPTNIIYQPDKDEIIMVDYEMTGINTPLKDLGSYLFMSALTLTEPNVEENLHSKDYKDAFLRTYLTELYKLNKETKPVTDPLIERYQVLIERTFLAFIILSLAFNPQFINTAADKLDPNILINMTKGRLGWYKKNKDRILNTTIPDA